MRKTQSAIILAGLILMAALAFSFENGRSRIAMYTCDDTAMAADGLSRLCLAESVEP